MQCKARWYEWLHPRINKTEWTGREDETLLHAVKVTPGQWRTIAGRVVGRTASDCIERYERLLGAACGVDDDVRKLKHVRPDPVDMEANEVQMISEAWSRLSDTMGKKGIRKAREKQLEEGRRLASLQKKRELKAAQIDDGNKKRKVKGIDYNAESLFEKKPPLGFYDATDERYTSVEEPQFPTTIEELESEKRFGKEARLRRNKTRRQDVPSAILQANKLIDQETVRKRPKINLPAPQILDHQLKHIAKFRPS